MILSHEGWLLPLSEPSTAAWRKERIEETETFSFSLSMLCTGTQEKTHCLLQHKHALDDGQRKE